MRIVELYKMIARTQVPRKSENTFSKTVQKRLHGPFKKHCAPSTSDSLKFMTPIILSDL